MFSTSTLYPVVAVAAAILATPVPSSAQLVQKPNPVSCPKGAFENDDQWARRCAEEQQQQIDDEASRRSRAMTAQIAATARQRAALEKQPPLPAARNRLLGRWKSSEASGGGGNDPFAQLAALTKGCNVLIGDGILEFQPARMAMYDSSGRNDMGAVEYRGGANGAVYVLPAKGGIFELLPFEFENPDRIHLVGVVCTLVRTNAGAPAAAPAGRATPAAPPASRGAGAKPVPAAAAATPSVRPPAVPQAGLVMMRQDAGYECADGVKLGIRSCGNDTDDADCLVVRVDLPPRNGSDVTFVEKRGVLVKRVTTSCTQRRLILDKDKNFALAP